MKNIALILSTVLGGLLLSILPITLPSSAASAPVGGYTLTIGDSLTYYGRDSLKARRPGWIVDGVRGRLVSLTPERIMYWSMKRDRQPARIVVALGSNDVPYWLPSDYRMVQKMLPHTVVLFVTPWRDPKVFGKARARTMWRYAESMRSLARNSNRVCVADWAARVRSNPDRFLRDGVHQTKYGLRVWSWLIASRMDACIKAAS